MKVIVNPFFRTLLVLGIWFLCFRELYRDFTHRSFLDLEFPLLVLCASVVSFASFLVDYKRYRVHRKVSLFFTTFVSVVCVSSLIGFDQYLIYQDKTPTILYASRFYDGLSTISIDFRENGTYKCENGGLFGDRYYTRGRYSIKDSIIQLDQSNLYHLIKTDKLQMITVPKQIKAHKRSLLSLLFGSSSKPDTLPETYIFQIDQKGDTIPSAIVLRVQMK